MTSDTGMPSVFCLVPARSGSARIADKNLQRVGGLTLLERAVRTCLDAFGEVIVSTDSQRYAEQARAAGAQVPGLRPAAIAASGTPMDDVVQHALREWAPADAAIMVLVQATTPFLTAGDLRGVVAALERNPSALCALTVARVPPTQASLMIEERGLLRYAVPELAELRSQDVPALAMPTGGAFAARADRLRRGEPLQVPPFVAVWVDPDRAVDIDEPADLERARALAGDPG